VGGAPGGGERKNLEGEGQTGWNHCPIKEIFMTGKKRGDERKVTEKKRIKTKQSILENEITQDVRGGKDHKQKPALKKKSRTQGARDGRER